MKTILYLRNNFHSMGKYKTRNVNLSEKRVSFALSVGCLCAFTVPQNARSADNCNQAAAITVGTACNYSTYTNATATNSTTTPLPACGNFSTASEDVWFTAPVPASGHLIIDTNRRITDGAMAIYTEATAMHSLL